MARRLFAQNELVLRDNLSGTDIVLYYTMPTNKQRLAYQNASVVRKNGQVENHTTEARQKYGLEILAGFREGDFENSEGKPISSDPKSENYEAGWKEMVADQASDLVELLAAQVFDVSARIKRGGEDAEKN
jgi:hypothetical protein